LCWITFTSVSSPISASWPPCAISQIWWERHQRRKDPLGTLQRVTWHPSNRSKKRLNFSEDPVNGDLKQKLHVMGQPWNQNRSWSHIEVQNITRHTLSIHGSAEIRQKGGICIWRSWEIERHDDTES
jgi:gamma-glutamyltranspeptidase